MKNNLESQPAMVASASDKFITAKRRALTVSGSSRSRTSALHTRFHDTDTFPAQYLAISVCSSVREEPVARPSAFVSLKFAVYRSLVNAGGPAGRNCEGESST